MALIPNPVGDVLNRVDGTLATVDGLLGQVDGTLSEVNRRFARCLPSSRESSTCFTNYPRWRHSCGRSTESSRLPRS
jgi:hypothetical protein